MPNESIKSNESIKFNPCLPSSSSSKPRNSDMVFASNPLSLSVPEPAFESWLRDSGYLETLDHRTTQLHRLNSAPQPSDTTTPALPPPQTPHVVASSLFSKLLTLLSLFTFNPFSKLAVDDFSASTPPWTLSFFASLDSYSFPSSPSQARLRVHENLKRFARNYASLVLLFFACSLYQLPVALFGLISCLALWEFLKVGGDRWGLDGYPLMKEILIRLSQCATAVILFTSNVQLAILFALGVSYAVMILHASFRRLTPVNQHAGRGGHRKAGRR